MGRSLRIGLFATAVILVAALGVIAKPLLTGAVVGLQAGMCEQVTPDPQTGEKLVYCCLDEIYEMQQRQLLSDLQRFVSALEAAANLPTDQGEQFFLSAFDSALHREFSWNTVCGPKIACELCVMGPLCGNRIVQEGEECDDGNTFPGDGCSAACVIEKCGDGAQQQGEECDDGNALSNDGCSTTCKIEKCGDGVKQTGEECDDGNAVARDGCTENCKLEYRPACGNTFRDAGEECDDGNTAAGDGCSPTCTREFNPQIAAACGNGVLEQNEECDDGNTFPGDGCNPGCRLEILPAHPPAPPEPSSASSEMAESMPQSSALSSVVAILSEEREEVVPPAPEDAPVLPSVSLSCGNGIIEFPEECDDGGTDAGDGCDGACTIEQMPGTALCGNGTLDRQEGCDDGGQEDGDGCSALCALEPGIRGSCGDGMVTAGEQCDDGNTADQDGCSRLCRIETAMVIPNPACGNGNINPGEECDDGNGKSGDGCTDTCFFEEGLLGDGIVQHALGEQCEPLLSTVPCLPNGRFALRSCGNGVLDPQEECDAGEGNANTPGAICRTDCSRAACGDGVIDPGEECDDGNWVNGDSCSRSCKRGAGGHEPVTVTPSPVDMGTVQAQLNYAQQRRSLERTGPAAIITAAAGAAAGIGWMRRRRALA